MFPLNDFNFVACALATFSAAVGYKYTRSRRQEQTQQNRRGRSASWASSSLRAARLYLPRRYSSVGSVSTVTSTDVDGYTSDCPTPSDFACDETEPGSLKRKHRPEPLNNSFDSDDKAARCDSLPPAPKRLRSSTPEADVVSTPQLISETDMVAASPQPATPPPLTPEVVLAEVEEAIVESAPCPPLLEKVEIPTAEVPPQTVMTPKSPTKLESNFTIPACKPSNAFSAFAGTSSAFSSAFASASIQKPAWCASEVSPAASIANVLDLGSSAEANSSTPLGTQVQAQATSIDVVTGEEDEDVEAELKGVKLFVKRGSKEFADGILGHIKFLSHKSTKDERIVFRREPVWKVSMSVRLRPIVRCHFDEEHGILKLSLKERVVDQDGVPSADCGEEVVIYALKRGKVPKSDFADFAKGVAASSRLISSSPDQTAASSSSSSHN